MKGRVIRVNAEEVTILWDATGRHSSYKTDLRKIVPNGEHDPGRANRRPRENAGLQAQ